MSEDTKAVIIGVILFIVGGPLVTVFVIWWTFFLLNVFLGTRM